MQHTQAWYRRTSAWVLAVLMLVSIGISMVACDSTSLSRCSVTLSS